MKTLTCSEEVLALIEQETYDKLFLNEILEKEQLMREKRKNEEYLWSYRDPIFGTFRR